MAKLTLYASDYDATISPELKKLFETARGREGDTHPDIEAFHTRGAELLHTIETQSAVYSVRLCPRWKDGRRWLVGRANSLYR